MVAALESVLEGDGITLLHRASLRGLTDGADGEAQASADPAADGAADTEGSRSADAATDPQGTAEKTWQGADGAADAATGTDASAEG